MAAVKSKIFIAVGALLLLWFARLVWDYFDPTSPANQAMQIQLKLFGAAMYEYHSQTGRWPAKLDDLAQTSLPRRNYIWQQTASTLVFLWPQDLKPDPKDNADVLLAYDRGGLYNKVGRVWVCWGDLRTEHVRERDLRARLAKWKGGVARHFGSNPVMRLGQSVCFREFDPFPTRPIPSR